MFLDGHYLDGIIAVGGDAGQNVDTEFIVGSHAFALLGHTDVAFVDEKRLYVGLEIIDRPAVGMLGIPHLGREQMSLFVLNNAGGVGGYSFALASVPFHHHLVMVAVVQAIGRKRQLPHS